MKINHLNFSYVKTVAPIFKDLSLKFKTNQLNVILGPNGTGKSTLLDLIANVDNQRNSCFQQFPEISQIAYLTQHMSFPEEATGQEIIDLICSLDQVQINFQNEETKSYLQKITPLRLGNMSGGERRFIMDFCVSCLNRNLFLFDEPDNALDPYATKLIMFIFEHLIQQGKQVILTTHHIENVPNYNAWIVQINHGTCKFQGDLKTFKLKINS
ncbi:putative ATP-binding protein [Pediococcus damnosus]|uniref:ATP-binding protein n=1 Tax=Pediococcus damnosus TaxID=51663 RepID=A0A0R2HM68_9LACO|nr:ABC transporter ATP-binding protein [Pediococcus damnosus]AMV60307.1 putative ATP-binding protein [Pediococcus damnosus]AMV62836.1 putative ATP-binding protein [Pediococcus damnosus]AMV64556.1 putative ATP-binding protein [Pediococcus damnosus]AMV67279.1 putative ATP-binding protein [Pediococcus damnosus]AMV69580.1 putative ATP-binding protein [Pediococcus damnosus]